jgi:hypothetical protein
MALSVHERIAQVAEHIATHNAHGYSQPNRAGDGTTESVTLSDGSKVTIHGGDYDCSEMARVCVNCALSGSYRKPVEYMWTGDEDAKLRAQGFTRLPFEGTARRGDVLWVRGHTGVALGSGLQADAHGDEYGGISGPNRGDQTGREVEVRALRPWTYIYRYKDGSQEEGAFTVQAKVKFPDGVNIRERPSVKSKIVGAYGKGGTCVIDGVVLADGIAWGTYVGASSGLRRYVCLGHLDTGRVVG